MQNDCEFCGNDMFDMTPTESDKNKITIKEVYLICTKCQACIIRNV